MNFLVKGIKKVDVDTDPQLLDESTASVLVNMVLDYPESLYRPRLRGGFQRYNSNQVDASNQVTSLHDIQDEDGNNYLLASVNGKLRKCDDGTGTWSDIKSSGVTGKARRSSYNGEHFFTTDSDTPFQTDLTNTNNLKIAAPGVNGLSLSQTTTGGQLGQGGYRWILVYITDNDEQGYISIPIMHKHLPTSGSSSYDVLDNGLTFGGTANTLDFSSLPAPSTDYRMTGKKLYRTKEDGQTFYLVASLDIDQTTFTDDVSDDDLDPYDTLELVNTPTKAKYNCVHRDRLFLANIKKESTNTVLPPAAQYVYDTDSTAYISQLFDVESTESTGGNIGDGTYRYKYSFLNVNGIESELSSHYAEQTFSTTAGDNIVRLHGWSRPFVGAPNDLNIDRDITAVRMYRTKDSGSTYYHIGDILYPFKGESGGGHEWYYEDDKNDTSLTEAYPKSGSKVGDTFTFKNGVVFSEIGKPAQFNETYLINVFPDDSDEIKGIFDDGNGVIVFKQRSICKIYTNGSPQNWTVQKLIDGVGSTEDVIIQNGREFLFFYNKQPYIWNGQLNDISYGMKAYWDLDNTFYDGVYWGDKGWYVVTTAYDTGGSLYGRIMIYSRELQTWYRFYHINSILIKGLTIKLHGDDAGTLLLGYTYVLDYDESTTSDYVTASDQNIYAQFATKHFTVPDSIGLARLRHLFLDYNKVDGSNIAFEILGRASSAVKKTHNDTSNNGWVTTRQSIEGLTGSLDTLRSEFYVLTEGAGLKVLNSIKIETRPKNRGRRVR